jgi:hypothetical protein
MYSLLITLNLFFDESEVSKDEILFLSIKMKPS